MSDLFWSASTQKANHDPKQLPRGTSARERAQSTSQMMKLRAASTRLLQLALCSSIPTLVRPVSTATSSVVRLQAGKARLFKNAGHPLVFSGAVDKVLGDPEPGAIVDVVDGKDGLIGWGVFNPHSMYRVRLLATPEEPALIAHRDLRKLIRHRLEAALKLRAALSLPSPETTAYRLINSEGDRLSGLTVDVFGGTAVAVTSAMWLEQRSDMVVECLRALPGITEVVWRRSDGRLQQDGWEVPNARVEEAEEHQSLADDSPTALASAPAHASAPAPAAPAPPPPPPPVLIYESGVKYLVAPVLGQKSGFYCDQRDNRRQLAELCRDKRVLDLFCYSGGFSLSAARAGARRCVGVDSSGLALDLARRNAALNGIETQCEFIQADVDKFLRAVHLPGQEADVAGARDAREVDVVICDPPKLAPSVKDLPRAIPK